MYTLRLVSVEIPVSNPESDRWVEEEAEVLRKGNWSVTIRSIQPTQEGYPTRYAIEAVRGIQFLSAVRDFWETKIFGCEPQHIGVVFPDSRIYRGKKSWDKGNWSTETFHKNGSLWWGCSCDPERKTVEVSVVGGSQYGLNNYYSFDDVLRRMDHKLRATRKVGQLVGMALIETMSPAERVGAVNRLRAEILEQFSGIF